jgi:hypothetical protein
MRHFVQFHNPDVWGEAVNVADGFHVSTAKPVGRALDQRIWLISRTGTPRVYFLASTFVADFIVTDNRRRFRNEIFGREGQVLGPSARIDTAPWWPKLLAQTGSFLWGLTEIRESSIIRGFEGFARHFSPSVGRVPLRSRRPVGRSARMGAGFGDPVSTRLVEKAAVLAVKRLFRGRGWAVTSVEAEARGFDLLCVRNRKELHVEVKGVAGDRQNFITPETNTANAARTHGGVLP